MDIWGYCERCDRWFAGPTDSAAVWTCQVCGMEPIRVESRAFRMAPSRAQR